MQIRKLHLVLLTSIICASCTDKPLERITAEGILSDVEALSADNMEGRAAGTPGAARAEAYIANRFEQMGLESFGDSYLLPVELVGMTKNVEKSSVSIAGPAGALTLENGVNFTFWSTAEKPLIDIADAPIVFVGYGVRAPEYDWDDFKDLDVRGKVLLFLNNDPQLEEDGEALFGGSARTYYGRWTYKFEQAEKLGAVGAIVVHTLESASYQFSVIGNTGSRRVWQRTYKLDFLSWMNSDTTSLVAASMGTTVPGLFEMANRREFRPVDTGYRLTAHIETAIERVEDANVVGVLHGNDADLADEYLVFTAHHDHLGTNPAVEGDDKIFNGAADNALGVAGMLAAAESAIAATPRRSIIFVATTAEEGGLLGSSGFVANPPVPLRQIVANFNIDSPQAFGLTRDIGAIGLEMSSLGKMFADVAAEHGFKAVGDPNPNAGSFYRSDQVNFATAGIPALYLQRGTDFITPPSFDPDELRLRNYHQVTDEILPEWDLAGVERDIKIFFEAALRAANADDQPRWVEGHEFEEEWKALYGLDIPDNDPPDYVEYDIESLQVLMQQGQLSSRELTQYYLDRIDAIDRNGPRLNSIIEVNPQAIEIATALDVERQASGSRGPMHGIPVVLKANIDTADEMETTAGSLAMKGHRPPADAFVVDRLRAAGAVILAKANLSEWANFRSTESSSGWSSIGGQTNNPYGTMRNPCGSSSGSAVSVAASLTSVAVGTETNGSVVCPASINGIVGIKPTLGLVSRSGIIPIAHSQDTAGPMGRTVKDTAILLSAMIGADPADPLASSFPETVPDFAGNLSKDALSGKRIGVYRGHSGAGKDARVEAIVADTIATLASLGAEIVDPVEIDTEGMSDASREVLFYEFKADLNKYLEDSGATIKSMAEIIEFNDANAETVMPFFGQERMLAAQAKGPLSEPEYLEALETSKRIAQTGINAALAEHELDALIAPTRGPAWMTDNVSGDRSSGISSSSLAAVSGYASITLPAGDILGLPIGISFIGAEFSDAKLIQFAYALEQAGYVRNPPPASR